MNDSGLPEHPILSRATLPEARYRRLLFICSCGRCRMPGDTGESPEVSVSRRSRRTSSPPWGNSLAIAATARRSNRRLRLHQSHCRITLHPHAISASPRITGEATPPMPEPPEVVFFNSGATAPCSSGLLGA